MESTLVEMLELAMDTTLEMNTDGVMKFTKDYDAAKHFIETFGKAKLEEYAEQLDPELVTAIREAAKAKEQEFKKQTKGKGLDVELILNTHDGAAELYVPVRRSGDSLDKDLFAHASAVFYQFEGLIGFLQGE